MQNHSDPTKEGNDIQKHLEQINMEAWYYIYQNYVNPNTENNKN